MNEFIRLLISFFTLNFLNKVIPFISIPLLTNRLGIDVFGTYTIVLATIGFFELLINFGLKTTGVNELILCQSKEKENELFFNVLLIKGAIAFLIIIVVFPLINFLNLSTVSNYLIYSTPLLVGFVLNQEWFFQAKKKMKAITIIAVFSRLSYLVFLFNFVLDSGDLEYAILAYAGMFFSQSLLGNIFAIYTYRIKIKIISFNVFNLLIRSGYFFISSLNVYLYTGFNYIILGFFYNATLVGLYSIADKITNAFKDLVTPFNNSIYPILSEIHSVDTEKYKSISKQYSQYLTLFFIIFPIGIFFTSELILNFFIKNQSEINSGKFFLKTLSLGIPINALLSFYTLNFIIKNKQKQLFKITLFTGIFSILLLGTIGNFLKIEYFVLGNICVLSVLILIVYLKNTNLKFGIEK
ncbi:oligosaccharide flippase family protein [Flavobacteriaceae bacterium]|nr:oligosaccharide flippase family protein [Flavobacteriaceae bacterium]